MQNEISYEYSPQLARTGTRRFIFRHAGPWLVAYSIAAVLALAGLNAGKETAFCWCVIIVWAFHAVPWARYYREAVRRGQEMPDRKVTLRIEPDGLAFQTSLYASSLKWAGIKKLWVYPDIVLLFYDKAAYSVLPAAALAPDALSFIGQKVKEHGGTVVSP